MKGKKKKWFVVLSLLASVAMLANYGLMHVIRKTCLFYEYESFGEFGLGVNVTAKICFYGSYTYDGDEAHRNIMIPDEYNGYKVVALGGYCGRGAPTAFFIDLSSYASNATGVQESCEDNSQNRYMKQGKIIQDIPFILNLGKNIEGIDCVIKDNYYPHMNEDGSTIYYHPVVYINCSPNNKIFYTEEGKLYRRQDHTLVDDFAYTNNES